jgi:hypothetical protein
MESLIKETWYRQLVEDCKDILVETNFAWHWSLVAGYHALGERIALDLAKTPSVGELLQQIATDLKLPVKERTLRYALAFYTAFPDLAALPEGKNITWTGIIRKYLTGYETAREEKKTPLKSPPLPGPSPYLRFVEGQPCIICGKKDVEKAHWPRTQGAGAPEHWVIPLCRECHAEMHNAGVWTWSERYADKLGHYFFDILKKEVADEEAE